MPTRKGRAFQGATLLGGLFALFCGIERSRSNYVNQSEVSDLVREIAEEFGLGECLHQEPIGKSARGILALTTDAGKFVLKPENNRAYAAVYSEVEQALNADGVRQARVFKKHDGSLISRNGYMVQEWIDGAGCDLLTPARLASAMGYMAAYNSSLARLSIPAAVTDPDNPWNRAASFRYILDELPDRIDDIPPRPEARAALLRSIAFLRERRASLGAPVQLIHNDIGPGNILFSGDSVVTIVDFSPHAAPELVSLCHFFYWQFLWGKDVESAARDIRESLDIYCQEKPGFSVARADLHTMLVFAATYRLLGPLLAMDTEFAGYGASGTEYRASLLKRLIDSGCYDFTVGL
jgi:Ser/Thr protein kinase RdoA (MazF antagonist)